MHKNSTVNIGIIGLGYIGSEVFRLLCHQNDYILKKIGRDLRIIIAAEKNTAIKKEFEKKYKSIRFTDDAGEVINNEGVDIVVELIGGLDPAYEYIIEALKKGKYVVTANKDLIAKRGAEIFAEAEKSSVDILFEASVGGGIPIIGPLKSSLASNNISKVVGIVNGTTNFILTKMKDEKLGFNEALKLAQKLGYAEANPEADIEGIDAANKLAILSSIAFNSRVHYEDVYREGIRKISISDINYADELGYIVKLLAIGSEQEDKINVRVHPALIPRSHILASIKDNYNAVYFYGNYVGEVMSFGKGAGDKPTASSVVGDIISIARNYDRANKKAIYGCTCFTEKPVIPFMDTYDKFYMLIDVVDRAGVLAKIAKIFGDNAVSIQSMLQKQIDVKDTARLIFITHSTLNKNLYESISQISELDVVKKVLNIIRVEEL
ncbi:MAG: homoserine dehydrogenase [Actinobacteria bacterium]|nr:homoserine dehydrogenase [Actinomycetota bacterium]MBM3712256.1 homoserine dehydrogenase [Actinomycetota bacterium]